MVKRAEFSKNTCHIYRKLNKVRKYFVVVSETTQMFIGKLTFSKTHIQTHDCRTRLSVHVTLLTENDSHKLSRRFSPFLVFQTRYYIFYTVHISFRETFPHGHKNVTIVAAHSALACKSMTYIYIYARGIRVYYLYNGAEQTRFRACRWRMLTGAAKDMSICTACTAGRHVSSLSKAANGNIYICTHTQRMMTKQITVFCLSVVLHALG